MGRGTGRCLVWPERGPGGGLHRGHVRRPFSTSGRRPVAVADRRRRRPTIRYLTCDGAGQAWCLPRPRRVGVDPRGSVRRIRCVVSVPWRRWRLRCPGRDSCGLAALGRPQGDPDRGCRAALADSRRPFAPGGSQTAVAGNRRVCRCRSSRPNARSPRSTWLDSTRHWGTTRRRRPPIAGRCGCSRATSRPTSTWRSS